MERRYLAATIAMAATFALFSHAFSSGLLDRVHDPRATSATLVSEMHCAAQSLRARLLDKVNRSLGTGNAEEAQMRVELNLNGLFGPSVPAVAPAVPAAPSAVASAPPAAPANPKVISAKASKAPVAACPTQRLMSEVRLPRDLERAQARAMALQSRALATQARLMAVQARLTAQSMQREITRTALAQARVNIAQARTSRPCDNLRALHIRSGDRDIDVNVQGLSDRINDEVQRNLESVRNF